METKKLAKVQSSIGQKDYLRGWSTNETQV
jgi:hypothetical protein